MNRQLRSTVVLLVVVAAVVAATGASLPPPPLAVGPPLDSWYHRVGPSAAALSVARIALALVVVWLMVVVSLQVLARWVRSLRGVADLLAPPVLRGVAGGVAGLSIGLVAGPPPLAGDGPGTAVLRPLDGEAEVTAATTSTTAAPPTTPTTAPATTVPMSPDPPRPAPAAPAVALPTATEEGELYVVRDGDHLWAIAADVVADVLGRAPSDREVARYWVALVAANQDRLVDPTNADLVYAHQVLLLPPT